MIPSAHLLRSMPRYLPRMLQVLRAEGIGVLVAKLRRRLGTTPLHALPKPHLLRFRQPYPALRLASAAEPRVSIIIPVHNHFAHTYHCLAALAAHGAPCGWEVIVVDDASSDETAAALAQIAGIRVVRNRRNLGFVETCNRGAGVARGEIVVFLNNDTQVQPGWLAPVLALFDERACAGIVGSRLVYPDGRQQEAGGIVFGDGSAWNYGHLDDPHKPEFCYVRAVDYVSGAALAIRRTLFEGLGGFGQAFAPGYYEDADLAFRVREAGFEVWYHPHSVVVHCEGVSAGTDASAHTGMKRFQSLHQVTFKQLWAQQLQHHGRRGEQLDVQRERHIRGRVLVVDVYMLQPDRESGSVRMTNVMRILRDMGYQLTFAALSLEAPQPYVANLQRLGVEVLYRPYVRTPEQHLRKLGGRYDLVLLSRADSAARLLDVARRHCPRARVVFDTVDLHFLREQRLAALTQARAIAAQAQRRRREELALIARADTTLVVSTAERELLTRECPGADVRILSNVHEVHGRGRPFAQRRGLLFIGAFAHPPNVDAVLWFCEHVLALVTAHDPDITLTVIGAAPPDRLRALAGAQVRIAGHVPDVAPYFEQARLSVAPLRYGAGVKGKINQSLAFGLPVIATTVAAEGMYLQDRESVMLADEPAHFARAIHEAYHHEALWEQLSDGGLRVMRERFSFDIAREQIASLLPVRA